MQTTDAEWVEKVHEGDSRSTDKKALTALLVEDEYVSGVVIKNSAKEKTSI